MVDVNDKRKKSLVNKVKKVFGDKLIGRKIAILGLTFKPNTDDMRDSPSLELVPSLVADGSEVRAFDPKGMDEAKTLSGVEPFNSTCGHNKPFVEINLITKPGIIA